MYKIVNKRKLWATRMADGLGKLFFLPRRLFFKSEPIDPGKVRSILVIRTAYLGDVMMTLPMLKPLRQRFPDATLSFLTSAAAGPLLENNPDVDEIITYDPFWFYPSKPCDYGAFIRSMRKRRFDLVIEARGDLREILALVAPLRARYKVSYGVGGGGYLLTHVVPYPGLKHKVEYHLDIVRYLGCDVGKEVEWKLRLADAERAVGRRLLETAGVKRPFVCVHPGGRLPLKRWGANKFAALGDRIEHDLGLGVVLLGSQDEQELAARVSAGMNTRQCCLAGQLNLREMAGVLAEAALFIGNDSGPMHIATAMGTPTVAIFGPSKSVETRPYGDAHQIVEKSFTCRAECDESHCRNSERQACLKSITPEDVLNAARSILRKPGKTS
ncbi:MAG: glycosyltransferase family 9 protein [Kiritimatiellae bacterium]|nr:glycosyltransferase family 9 protein [Kiritimatiellia bacterium]